jgi:hypothetical protein
VPRTISAGRELFAVVADGKRWANVQGALGCRSLLFVLGLLVKIDVGFVVVVFYKIGRFVKANATGSATVIYIPISRNVLCMSSSFICHGPFVGDFLPLCKRFLSSVASRMLRYPQVLFDSA